MSSRREQRRETVFALYQSDLTEKSVDQLLPLDASEFMRALGRGVEERSGDLDTVIGRHAEGWSVERIAPLERSILRVALYELIHPDRLPGRRDIPAEGAIDEAVELAKRFCGADAPGFINGILAAALRELPDLRENGDSRE